MKSLPAILSISFRPFFLLAALIAILNPVLWALAYLGQIDLPHITVSTLFWHGHEMIFGFSGALIAGFILTASANWTQSNPYQGKALLVLILVWLLERIIYFLPLEIFTSFLLMNAFFPTLSFMLFLKLKNFPKQKYVFMPILLGLTTAKALHSWGHLFSDLSLEVSGKELAVGLIRLIVLLIAGRVLPFFSRKKIPEININVPVWATPLSLAPLVVLAVPWPQETPRLALAFVYLVAIFFNIFRQLLWKPQKTIKVPILFVLHVGVAFIHLGLIQEFISLFAPAMNFSQAPLHMLMAAGLGTVAIGIITRVSLGHTGRPIVADRWIQTSYLCIALGGFTRALLPVVASGLYTHSLYFSSGLWGAGFLFFLVRFSKILLSPRPDSKAF